jgi:hypothetical protein
MSNGARFGIGVLLSLPALFLAGVVQAVPHMVQGALSLPPDLAIVSSLALNLALLALFILGLVKERTRFVVLGMMAGVAILFVLAAGACILLLTGVTSLGQ